MASRAVEGEGKGLDKPNNGRPPEQAQLQSGTGTNDMKEQVLNRSKKQSKRKGGSRGLTAQEEVLVGDQQADFVRVLRVEKGKVEAVEDPTRVQLSKTNKAAQLTLSEDRLSVTGHKGFRTARASHGAWTGTWYCEVKVSYLGKSGHVRLGWCTKKAELQAPVGFDQFGYAYRDLEGSKVHQGSREPYGQPFGEGDVVGMLIHLADGGRPLEAQDRSMVRFKGAFYYVEEAEPKPQPVPGSFVMFTVNGVPQGKAYEDILEGTYYPAVSLYTLPDQAEGATATFNFGPDFTYPPPEVERLPAARAVSELATPALTQAIGSTPELEPAEPAAPAPAAAVPVDAHASEPAPAQTGNDA
mmetsp:Transcript_34989/g.77830  ORF Transcript_34989/g.77830 Transcript_34989/m.77830 type:complete len:356 (+) Transcript_34989:227-1294(+)|eukprot:CAMPEP_0202890300 /NCGR_PEP_ID=MMETSP1392-20130828/758_1 /ASSEMBLY_ACC=CAM_ASM_000868 /TAXON_ID=225041 /ORGANISM="Chlamydomonas chlamydogama, Strain SAG 11-48b" /LENGTH=355 /DNA_ID=CAMNT_0049573847 /DNA_START=208 /DNA_END=1275 /DNA_ORIENTATION=-